VGFSAKSRNSGPWKWSWGHHLVPGGSGIHSKLAPNALQSVCGPITTVVGALGRRGGPATAAFVGSQLKVGAPGFEGEVERPSGARLSACLAQRGTVGRLCWSARALLVSSWEWLADGVASNFRKRFCQLLSRARVECAHQGKKLLWSEWRGLRGSEGLGSFLRGSGRQVGTAGDFRERLWTRARREVALERAEGCAQVSCELQQRTWLVSTQRWLAGGGVAGNFGSAFVSDSASCTRVGRAHKGKLLWSEWRVEGSAHRDLEESRRTSWLVSTRVFPEEAAFKQGRREPQNERNDHLRCRALLRRATKPSAGKRDLRKR
jgi:hypothetical protein